MLPASGEVGSDPYAIGSLKTAAINLRAGEGTVTRAELLLTPNAESVGLPNNPEVLYQWESEDGSGGDTGSPGDGNNVYEAEDYTALSDVGMSTAHPGYSGSGFADFGGNGSWLEWNNVRATFGGSRTLEFRYAGGSSARPSAVYVNGVEVGQLDFTNTGGWDQWATESIEVSLKGGDNKVRVLALSNGGTNLDYMKVGGSLGFMMLPLLGLLTIRWRRRHEFSV